ATTTVATTGGPPPPNIDGKVCPVGTPNGFIDSWGFPRSGGRTHQGVDMFAKYGSPIYAVADGVVDRAYSDSLGGLAIIFVDDHGDKYYYAHMSSLAVRSGQRMTLGAVMGAVGTSGNAAGTPAHLHWQYHPGGGDPVNPTPLATRLCR
ncbi:MAG: M23 family metallopeptidase, partial [Egibacteraceae bacterium]